MSKFLVIFNTKIIFVQFVYMSIFLFIYQYRGIFFYNFYSIANCLKKKSATRSPIHMHGYPARAFDSSLVIYIERDVLRTITNI